MMNIIKFFIPTVLSNELFTFYKGGGGGGSGTPYYANQDQLFGVQATMAQNLYNQYAEVAPEYLENSQRMTREAMDGTLAARARDKAGADASQAFGQNMAAVNRNTARFGAEFNPNRMASMGNAAAVAGSAQKANAMNQAGMWAEDQKWNRNANAYGQIAGMGAGAMAGMGSAGAGYGSMAAQANAASMANAQGFGKFGAGIAGIGMGYAKGGEVKLAEGGTPVRKPFVNRLTQVDWRSMPVADRGASGNGLLDAAGAVAMGAAPVVIGLGVKDLLKGKDSTIRGWLADDKVKKPEPVASSSGISEMNSGATSSSDTYKSGFEMAERNGFADPIPEDPYVDPGYDAYTPTPELEMGWARGGFIKRGVKLASGGFAQPIGDQAYASDPDRFRGKPLSAGDQFAMRAGSSLAATATNPLTYVSGYNRYQKLAAEEARQKPLIDSKPDTPGVAQASPVEAPAQVQEMALPEASPAASAQDEFSKAFASATDPTQTAAQGGVADVANVAGATEGAAPAISQAADVAPVADGATATTDGAAAASDATTNAASSTADAAAGTADAANSATSAASSAMDGAGAAIPVVKGLADIANGRDAGEAVADAAAGWAGAKTGAMIGSYAGPVGTVVGGVLGGVLGGSIFADGGEVEADPYRFYQKPEKTMEQRISDGFEYGPGSLGPLGVKPDDMNDAQRIASISGDVVAVNLFKQSGGEIEREDFKPGGEVDGPGTETSDDIPAWLSDGEVVHNAEAVKLAGKDALLAINDAGLQVREGNSSPEEARAQIGQVMMERGKQLVGSSGFIKRGVHLAGGGFLGGNLGVALGAGVDQFNRQQMMGMHKEQLDIQRQNAERAGRMADAQLEAMAAQQAERKAMKQASGEANDMVSSSFALKDAFLDMPNRVKSGELTQQEAEAAQKAYRDAGYSPEDLAKKAGSKLGEVDLVRGVALGEAAQKELYGKEFNRLVDGKAPLSERVTAMAKMNPQAATQIEASMVSAAERAENQRKLETMREESRLREIALRSALNPGRGVGGSGGSGERGERGERGGDGGIPFIPMKDAEKILGGETPEQTAAIHGHYTKIISNMDPSAFANPLSRNMAANAAVMMAQKVATGQAKPIVSLNPRTLGFDRGMSDEQGNDYLMDRNVDPTKTIDHVTRKPYLSGTQFEEAKRTALTSLKESDPQSFDQAKMLAGNYETYRTAYEQAKRYPSSVSDAQWRVLNAATYLLNGAGQPAPGKPEPAANLTEKRATPWGIAGQSISGTAGFISDEAAGALNSLLKLHPDYRAH